MRFPRSPAAPRWDARSSRRPDCGARRWNWARSRAPSSGRRPPRRRVAQDRQCRLSEGRAGVPHRSSCCWCTHRSSTRWDRLAAMVKARRSATRTTRPPSWPGHQRGRGDPHRALDRRGAGEGRAPLAGGPRKRCRGAADAAGVDRRIVKVGCSEIFGPVMCIVPFATLDEAIARVNATPFGLATGIFTNRLDDAFAAAQRLGRWRARQRDVELASGPDAVRRLEGQRLRPRGPRYAVHEMTEERIVTFTIA